MCRVRAAPVSCWIGERVGERTALRNDWMLAAMDAGWCLQETGVKASRGMVRVMVGGSRGRFSQRTTIRTGAAQVANACRRSSKIAFTREGARTCSIVRVLRLKRTMQQREKRGEGKQMEACGLLAAQGSRSNGRQSCFSKLQQKGLRFRHRCRT